MLMIFDTLHWCAFLWFIMVWVGYTFYAKRTAGQKDCIAAVLNNYRIDWVINTLHHENRIADFALLENLTRTVNFFASTTILVLAGLITVFYSADGIVEMFSHYSFIQKTTHEQVQFKLMLLIVIFIFAFFRFTWSMRQYSFVAILLGSAPHIKKGELTNEQEKFAKYAAKIADLAGHEFNYGLRAYYFALATLSWFISSWAFILACTFVVLILYRREFQSRTLTCLIKSRNNFIKLSNKK